MRTWHKVTVDDVEQAVTALVDGDMAVTYLAVAEALGVSPNRITDNDELRAAVDRVGPVVLARWCAAMRAKLAASRDRLRRKNARVSRANLATDAQVSLEAITRFERETGETFAVSPREEYEKLVGGAIVVLRERGERITTVAVARELGRERSFIEKNPDLKQMVQAARTAKPTVEMGVWTADGGRSTSHDPFVFGVVILNAQPNTVHVKFRISYSLMRILEQPGLRRKFDLVTRPVVQQMASPSIVPLQTRLGGPRSA